MYFKLEKIILIFSEFNGSSNKSSTEHFKVLAIFNARTVDGT